jgi:hypothetical protein
MHDQRLLAQRQHRLLAMHLAVCCWLNQKDAVILERATFARYLGLERIKKARVYQFNADVNSWFPFTVNFFLSNRDDSLSSIILSRTEIPQSVIEGSKSTNERLIVADGVGFRLASSSKLSHRYPDIIEKNVVAELAVWASGLDNPSLHLQEET